MCADDLPTIGLPEASGNVATKGERCAAGGLLSIRIGPAQGLTRTRSVGSRASRLYPLACEVTVTGARRASLCGRPENGTGPRCPAIG
jgi:hypothetical protein